MIRRLLYFFCCLSFLPASADILIKTDVTGVQGAPAQNVSNRLNDAIQSIPQPIQASDALSFYQYSDETAKGGITPFGYFEPQVHKSMEEKNSHWQWNYHIEPGKQTKIKTIHLNIMGEGQFENSLRRFFREPPFHVGDPFLSGPYEDYKKAWMNAATDLGYIDAKFTSHEVLINRKNHTAIIALTLDTGARYYFGDVHFNSNPLRDSFLQRFVKFSAGQPYSSQKTYELQTDLTNSGYFQSAVVTPHIKEADAQHRIPITTEVKTKPQQQYIMGVGYGTDTGPRATFGSDWRYVNSYGHRFNTAAQLSQVQKTASAKYIIPGKHPLSDEYNINTSLQNNTINQGTSQVKQLGGGYTLTRGQWQRSFNLSYQIEHYSFFGNPYLTSYLFLPGVTIQNIVKNNPLFVTEGHYFNWSVIGAKEGALSDTNLVQSKISSKWIHSLSQNNIIVLRNDMGYTAIHDITKLPLSLSYFTGGSQTVRGYAYNDLGPGRYLFVASAEYRYQFIPKWYAATFFDLGNAFYNFPTAPHPGFASNLGAFYNLLQRGAGVGVVWNSPVGTMELTVAQAITRPGRSNRVQFNMGSDF